MACFFIDGIAVASWVVVRVDQHGVADGFVVTYLISERRPIAIDDRIMRVRRHLGEFAMLWSHCVVVDMFTQMF